jgi:hypothetical protein
MAVKKEIESANAGQRGSGWIEGEDENGEVIFVKPTTFNPEEHTEASGHVMSRKDKQERFGTHRPIRQRVSL